MRFQIAVLGPTLLALLPLLALAQTPPTEPAGASTPAERFGETIAITEVEIPVQVLHRGEPVGGLAIDDFEVFDEGDPAEIVGFRAVDLSTEVASGGNDSLLARPPVGGMEESGVGAGRHILLAFDFLFGGHLIERALHNRGDRITGQLHPSDRVAVAILSGDGARLVLGFTQDPEKIHDALDFIEAIAKGRDRDAVALSRRLAVARGSATGQRSLASTLDRRFGTSAAVAMLGGVDIAFADGWGGGGVGFGGGGVPFGDGTAQSDPAVARVAETDPFKLAADAIDAREASSIKAQTDQIARLATLLRDVPAPKRMVLFSRGVSSGIFHAFDSPQRPRVLRYLGNMHEALRRASWTLDAYDLSGIPNPFAPASGNADTLFYYANETGGHLFANYNRIPDATERLLYKTRVTYVLTIRPPADLPANGRLRRLEVRLKDQPLLTRLYHRTGYYAPKPAAERSTLERKLDTIDLLLGEAETEGLPVTLDAEAGAATADGLAPVALLVTLPAEVFRGDSGPTTQVQIQVYAVDSRGGVQDLWMRRVALDREKVGAQLSAAGLQVAGTLSLPPGEYRLRSLVRHPASGRFTLKTTVLEIER